MPHALTVLKLGGSVLRGHADLPRAVNEIQRWIRQGHRVIAVVSAFEGTTDALLESARQSLSACSDSINGNGTSHATALSTPSQYQALALLLATGECTTAALLTLALQGAGINTSVLNPHTLQLHTHGQGDNADPKSIDIAVLRRTLDNAAVVVIPGFIGVDEDQHFTLLGRGGSDLTALFIAAQLDAKCRLIKDVDGLYEHDPAIPGPRPRRFRSLSWDDALGLDEGIVQHKAIKLAREHCLEFEVGTLGLDDSSTVGNLPIQWHEFLPENIHAGSATG